MKDTEKIDLSAIIKAQKKFEEFRKELITEKDKEATVQAFEFCYELSWKLMKKILNQMGVEVNSPKVAFREAGLNHLIDDSEVWFEFQEKRNLTVHSYAEENLVLIVSIFDSFSKEMDKFIKRVKDL